ncbi:phage holin family protein [bacterium]|nr:phage holin family protein [bacterium]
MVLIRQWLASALAFLAIALYLPGFHVSDPVSAVLASAVLGLFNAILRPILQLFAFPLTLMTFGLFLLVINGLMMWLVPFVVKGVRIEAFVANGMQVPAFATAMLAAVLVSLASWLIGGLLRVLTGAKK